MKELAGLGHSLRSMGLLSICIKMQVWTMALPITRKTSLRHEPKDESKTSRVSKRNQSCHNEDADNALGHNWLGGCAWLCRQCYNWRSILPGKTELLVSLRVIIISWLCNVVLSGMTEDLQRNIQANADNFSLIWTLTWVTTRWYSLLNWPAHSNCQLTWFVKPLRVSRSIPGNGPVEDVNSIDLQCHQGSTPAPLHATAAAGSTVTLRWTLWPDSHVGPVITYMARCPDTGCQDWEPGTAYDLIHRISFQKTVLTSCAIVLSGSRSRRAVVRGPRTSGQLSVSQSTNLALVWASNYWHFTLPDCPHESPNLLHLHHSCLP